MIQLENDFYKEEIRCGFKVTEKRKKCWEVLLNLLNEFDIFAKKKGIQYFVGYGTLLGAVRHSGFIPWDDDIDIVMKRDEYMKMSKYAREYFHGRKWGGRRLVFEDAYSYNTVFRSYFSKIIDYETTVMVRDGVYTGISMDLFPIDAMYDGSKDILLKSRIRSELWLCYVLGAKGVDAIKYVLGGDSILGDNCLGRICALPMNDRMEMYENHALSMWGKSEIVGDFMEDLQYSGKKDSNLSDWKGVMELPFENLMVPVPTGWNEILKKQYGEWQEYIMGGSYHDNSFYDPYTPFLEYTEGRKSVPAVLDSSL